MSIMEKVSDLSRFISMLKKHVQFQIIAIKSMSVLLYILNHFFFIKRPMCTLWLLGYENSTSLILNMVEPK